MIHLAAYLNAAAIVGSNPNFLKGVTDAMLAQDSAGNFLLPTDLKLIAAAYFDGSPKNAYLKSPQLNKISPRYIMPIVGALLPGSRPGIQIETMNPFQFTAQEYLSAYVNTALSVAGTVAVGVWLGDGIVPSPGGQVYEVHATPSSATTADVWSTVQYSFDQALPSGNYAMVGASVVSANGLLARWKFGMTGNRPGYPCLNSVSNIASELDRLGLLGVIGVFPNTNQPFLEVLSTAAETPTDIFMRLLKIS